MISTESYRGDQRCTVKTLQTVKPPSKQLSVHLWSKFIKFVYLYVTILRKALCEQEDTTSATFFQNHVLTLPFPLSIFSKHSLRINNLHIVPDLCLFLKQQLCSRVPTPQNKKMKTMLVSLQTLQQAQAIFTTHLRHIYIFKAAVFIYQLSHYPTRQV